MRSELIFGATTYVSNRFLLTRLASKAIRKFHKSNTRIEDTTNDIIRTLQSCQPVSRCVLCLRPAVRPLHCAS
jgi:hypothetical protein